MTSQEPVYSVALLAATHKATSKKAVIIRKSARAVRKKVLRGPAQRDRPQQRCDAQWVTRAHNNARGLITDRAAKLKHKKKKNARRAFCLEPGHRSCLQVRHGRQARHWRGLCTSTNEKKEKKKRKASQCRKRISVFTASETVILRSSPVDKPSQTAAFELVLKNEAANDSATLAFSGLKSCAARRCIAGTCRLATHGRRSSVTVLAVWLQHGIQKKIRLKSHISLPG